MAKGCFCGCGREVEFGRKRAANAVGASFDEHLSVLRGSAAGEGAAGGAPALDQFLARGQALRDGLRDVVHGTLDRKQYDKAAGREWLREALDHRKRLAGDAIEADYAGMNAHEQARLVHAGRSASAILLEVEDTRTTLGNDPRVRVRLRVEPGGEPPFEVERKLFVSRVAIPRPGERVEVFYDPDDRERFTFRIGDLTDDAVWAAVAPAPMDVAEQLEKLKELRDSGALDDEEFAAAKRRVLAGGA